MEAKELRYKNLVERDGIIYEVNDVFGTSGLITTLPIENKNSLSRMSILEFKPIPLTEEWSVRFGYECLIEMAVDFSALSKYDIEIIGENLKKLNVHEAQNLYFTLTGEELTLKS